jgi:hypothetical protein
MSTISRDLIRWNIGSVALGAVAWSAALLLRLRGMATLDDLDLFLLLAVAVIVPLTIPLAARCYSDPIAASLARIALRLQPFAAVFGSIALFAGIGSAAAAASAVLWLLYTALLSVLGGVGAASMFRRNHLHLAEACLALAFVYLPIGGLWFALARIGARPLGFGPTTVTLTAVHFHFISLAALSITGCTGLALRSRGTGAARNIYRMAAIGLLVCPLLVAAGITLTQLAGARALESVAAILLALNLMFTALLSLRFVVPTTAPMLARVLLAISGVAVLLTMLLATAYAVGGATGVVTITVGQMVATHGWLNALAFGLCGLLGWRLSMAWES